MIRTRSELITTTLRIEVIFFDSNVVSAYTQVTMDEAPELLQ